MAGDGTGRNAVDLDRSDGGAVGADIDIHRESGAVRDRNGRRRNRRLVEPIPERLVAVDDVQARLKFGVVHDGPSVEDYGLCVIILNRALLTSL